MAKRVNVSFDDIQEKGSFYIFKCTEIDETEALGDLISISKTELSMEISNFIDVDDPEVRDFIREFVVESQAVLGFMRRVTQ